MQMPAIFDFLKPADPNSEERQWSDVPIGLRLGVLGNQLMALSQGRAADPGGLALLERAGAQTQEERKAAKRKKMLQTYYAKHPNPQIRAMAENGMLDEDMAAAVLKDEMGFDRFKQEKEYESKLEADQKARDWGFLDQAMGGGAPAAGGQTMPSGSAELSGAGGGAPASGGVYDFTTEEKTRVKLAYQLGGPQAAQKTMEEIRAAKTPKWREATPEEQARFPGVEYMTEKGPVYPEALTEAQQKGARAGEMMEATEGTIEQFEDVLATDAKSAALWSAGASNYANPKYKQAVQAGEQWLMANLRNESGGAITEPEIKQYWGIFMPKYNDPPEVIEQKRRARAIATDATVRHLPARAVVDLIKAREARQAEAPPAEAAPQAAPEATGELPVGTVENGYRYKGGPPELQSSWEEVR